MVSERNRSIALADYISSLGLEVNLQKNKARGNKGFFANKNGQCRIDVSRDLKDGELTEVLIHEFAHYFHFTQDKSLKSLDFIFGDYDDNFLNELIEITVNSVDKQNASELFDLKEQTKNDIKTLVKSLQAEMPDFDKKVKNKKLESLINKSDLKYLLKHDNVKVLNFFNTKIYSIKNIDKDFHDFDNVLLNYVKLRSKERFLKKINSKISRINRYYNSPTELFARAFTMYVTNKTFMQNNAPNVLHKLDKVIAQNEFIMLNKVVEIYSEK